MSESKVDLDELQKLATEIRRAQSSLDAGVKGFANAPAASPTPPSVTTTIYGVPTQHYLSPSTTFGNTSAGDTCLGEHQQARSAMDSTLKAFAGTIESDAERLAMAKSTYEKVDAEQADRMLAISRNQLDILTTHLSTTGKNAELVGQQAEQINQLRGLVGDRSTGNMVVTGDFNAQAQAPKPEFEPSAQAIRNFGGNGFDINGGVIDDGRGGTSKSNLPIDHVMPRGVGAVEAQRWRRDQSDHDGQDVDITMPNW